MKRILLSFGIFFLCTTAFAQQDMLLYNMQGIPQSSYANPSNSFEGKFYIGLPALSSNYFNYTNSVRYSDAIVKQGDSLLLSFDNLIREMKDENYMSFNSRIDLLSFGITINPRLQLSFNMTEVFSMSLDYNKDLIRLIYEGNAAFLGSSPNLDGIGINASHYREYGLAANYQINEKLRVGTRLKYLYGMENIYTEKSEVQLNTDPETYELLAVTNFKMQTSGLGEGEDESFSDYFSGRNNQGFGVDLGAFYQLDEKFSFSASIVDLGYINWNDRTKSYTSEGSYAYDGVEVDVFGTNNNLTDEASPFDQILDSLEEELGIEEGEGSYSSPLVTKVYLGGNYAINEQSFAGVVIKTDIFQGRLRPGFSLSYARKMNHWITLTGAYSALNGAFDNIGVGFILDPGPVQFYLMTDNLLGTFTPQNTRNMHIRFGVNLIFGRSKDKEDLKLFRSGADRMNAFNTARENKTNEDSNTEDSSSEEKQDQEN